MDHITDMITAPINSKMVTQVHHTLDTDRIPGMVEIHMEDGSRETDIRVNLELGTEVKVLK